MYGQKYKTKSGITSYCGLMWGSVRNEDGSIFKYASDYFFKIKDDSNEAWDIISDKLDRHVRMHIGEVDRDNNRWWQSGFGGDEMDGLIDFCLPTPIECLPDMEFEILGKKYVMSFTYGGDDSTFGSEEKN